MSKMTKVAAPKGTPPTVAKAYDTLANAEVDNQKLDSNVKKSALSVVNGGGYWVRAAAGKVELLMREDVESDDTDNVVSENEFAHLAADKKPTDFSTAITTALYSRVRDAIDIRRDAVSADLFSEKSV